MTDGENPLLGPATMLASDVQVGIRYHVWNQTAVLEVVSIKENVYTYRWIDGPTSGETTHRAVFHTEWIDWVPVTCVIDEIPA